MRAIVALPPAGPGAPSQLQPQLQDVELPRPEPGPRDLRVRLEAVAVNPVDAKVAAALEPGAPPRLLGWDGAGVVEAVGEAVTRFKQGDRVLFAGDISRPGCWCEAALVDERITGRLPQGLGFADGAALPLTALTAWEALHERLGVDAAGGDAGSRLLVIGGAGGVGSLLIQLARRAGLEVIATASRPESRAWCRELGAQHVIDHRQPLAPQLAALGFAAVDWIANLHDTAAYWAPMADLIRPQGSIVAIVGTSAPLDLNLLKAKSVRFAWEFMFSRSQYQTPDMAEQGAILDQVAALVAAGELRSSRWQTLGPINAANLAAALAQLEAGHSTGKLVLAGWP
ncbi:MAG: zinc-binding alcohol dehydrogenase family protein [Prochlorococcaceae cyanobacterium]